MSGSNLYIEPVYSAGDRRQAYRVIYRSVEIQSFTRREHAEEFIHSIEESVR